MAIKKGRFEEVMETGLGFDRPKEVDDYEDNDPDSLLDPVTAVTKVEKPPFYYKSGYPGRQEQKKI